GGFVKPSAPSGVLLKKVKHSMVCHPDPAVAGEGSLQLFSAAKCGDASPAKRDQHDSVRVACFTYLRNAALALPCYIRSGWKEADTSKNDHWITLWAFMGARAIRLD